MPTHNLSVTFSNGLFAEASTYTITDEGARSVQVDIAGSTTDKKVAIAIDVSQMSSLFMSSTVAMKLETNDSSSPDDTINLAAGVPLIWNEEMPYDNPLGTDVTDIFVTVAGSDSGTLKIEVLDDVTP